MLIRFPLYFKVVIIFLGLFLFFYFMSLARHIIVLTSLSALVSILLLPLCSRLERWKFPRMAAIIICLIIVTIVLGLLGYFIYSQVIRFFEDLNIFTERLTQLLERSGDFFESHFGITKAKHHAVIKDSVNSALKSSVNLLLNTLESTGNVISVLGLVPVFTFFMLYYRDFFKVFLLKLFHDNKHPHLQSIIDKIEDVVQNYLTGVLIVTTIISAMNVTGLTILGVKFAFFFGVLAGLLNIIPYIGVFIGSTLPIAYTYIIEGSVWKAGAVMLLMWAIQFTEGHFITPNIVGSKVSLNPFAAILALIIGGQLWGPVGMILFIPFTAVLKVICDSIERLQPFGYVLGNPEVSAKKRDTPL